MDRGGWGQRGGAHRILRRERKRDSRAQAGETRRDKERQGATRRETWRETRRETWREYQVRTRVG